MPVKKAASAADAEISILEVSRGTLTFCLLGTTPLVFNKMSSKAKRDLLAPRKKTQVERASTVKHNPPEEYRASAMVARGDKVPTRLLLPATAFKGALSSVAIDIPGAAKAQIGRLTYVEGDFIHIYGVPELFMTPVVSAGMNKSPDIRTRAIIPKWACEVRITYIKPILREAPVSNLLSAAGMMRGVGDFRVEKGKGNYGQFEIVGEKDPRYLEILKTGGTKAQDAALKDPKCYDAESAELLEWWTTEMARRGFEVAS